MKNLVKFNVYDGGVAYIRLDQIIEICGLPAFVGISLGEDLPRQEEGERTRVRTLSGEIYLLTETPEQIAKIIEESV